MAKTLILPALALSGLISFGMSVVAWAYADPPGRVGRLSYVEGVVSLRAPGQSQWSPASLNYPALASESFWTEPTSRAEIQIGPAELRLDEMTAVDIVALDDARTQLQVNGGVINLHLRALPPGGVQITTPLGAIDLVEPGSYDIDAGRPQRDVPADRLVVTVLEGKAEASGPRSRVEIFAGESATVRGNPLNFTLSEGNATPFDDWALQRERREEVSTATRYVSPEETGYQDLDDYGRWSYDPAYGAVWYPTAVPVDWAPYRYGHWAWVAPWGWTWIDDAPWGFAPFHYGRWAEIGGGWAWCPGAVVPRPVYAPALVTFIGGSNFSVNITGGPTMGAVGWVPLAPFEVYHPYYRTSVAYVRDVNRTSVDRTVIRNITVVNSPAVVTRYTNNHAATVVPSTAFAQSAPVHKATLDVPRDELAQTRVTPSMAHIQPSAVARAGVSMPSAAERAVPRPNAPASISKVATGAALPQPGREQEPAVPKAPGPSFAHPETLTVAHPPAASTPSAGVNHPAPPASPPANKPQSASAPTAPARWAAASSRGAPAAAAQAKPPLMPVDRPAQQTRLAPTPQGWVRTAQSGRPPSHPAPTQPANHPAHGAPAPGQTNEPIRSH
jgi:hypothetical protein